MSQAVVDGLRSFGARRIVVATAYADEVNDRLKGFLTAQASRCWRSKASACSGSASPGNKSEADIIALELQGVREAPDAEGLLISCGGLRTLGVAKPLEERHGIPVVSSTQAAFWAAMRLVGESGHVAGHGRLLEQSAAAACALRRFAPKVAARQRFAANCAMRLRAALADSAMDPYRERRIHEGPRHRHPEVRHPRSPGQGDRGRAESRSASTASRACARARCSTSRSRAATASRPKPRSSRRPTSSSPIR